MHVLFRLDRQSQSDSLEDRQQRLQGRVSFWRKRPIEGLTTDARLGCPWGPGDNPKTALFEYLKTHPEFEIDRAIDHKLLISVAPQGFLKRVR